MLDTVLKYCDDVLTDKIPSGHLLKMSVSRFLRDFKEAGENREGRFVFKEDMFLKVTKFVAKLKHSAGKHANKPFKLEPWQLFIVGNLYGFYTQDGTRRFQTAYLEMARKQGKTALVAALAIYHLLEDQEEGAEVLFTANSLDQAKIGFRMVDSFRKKYDPDEKILFDRYRVINVVGNVSFLMVLAADSSKLDGYNCSMGVVDEYHEAPNSRVRDVLYSSMAMRDNPLLITITTAGFDKSLPCYELRTVCADILSGTKQDDSFFGVIYSLDEEDDWKNPAVWVKSNPNLGVTVNEAFLEKAVLKATNNPSDEVGVKTKNLNIWCDSSTVWIPDEYVLKSQKKLNWEDFKGEEVFVGVDLAANVDLTAVSYLVVKDGMYHFTNDYYVPTETLKARVHADKDLYAEWVRQRKLKTTAGNVTDYDYITRDMLQVNEHNSITNIYYDKYNANAWAIQCTEAGLTLEPFSQVISNFNGCTREFERLILSGKVLIDDSPITRYCLRNVELRYDFNGNCKPLKSNEKKKIDGVIAMLQALAAYMNQELNYKGTAIY